MIQQAVDIVTTMINNKQIGCYSDNSKNIEEVKTALIEIYNQLVNIKNQ